MVTVTPPPITAIAAQRSQEELEGIGGLVDTALLQARYRARAGPLLRARDTIRAKEKLS